jgi:hypothetical protein
LKMQFIRLIDLNFLRELASSSLEIKIIMT